MLYKREIFQIKPEKSQAGMKFFNDYIAPNQIKNGATLMGSWITDTHDEIVAIWEYPSYDDYIKIEARVKRDVMYQQMQAELSKVGALFLDSRQDFLTSTGMERLQKQKVSVSGYITNDKGETLLVNTYWRSDTWELPGGGVDHEETLDDALHREIREETGLEVELNGVTGVYSNGSTVTVVFRGRCVGGKQTTSAETKQVCFVDLDQNNVTSYITRGKFLPRVLDGMEGKCAPYESFKVRPYQLLKRINSASSSSYNNRNPD